MAQDSATNPSPALAGVALRYPEKTYFLGQAFKDTTNSYKLVWFLANERKPMPQSLSVIYVHLVFSTKDRRPFLRDQKLRGTLHAYLGEVSKRLDCPPILVGGVEDHVHILARFGRTISQAEWVKELKRVSNQWLKEQGVDFTGFEWKGGYADFSVSQSNLEQVKEYVARQEEHHRKLTFQDELRALLRKHQVQWDERYIWD